MVNSDDFKKLDIKIGTILEAEIVPKADRLLKLKVNLGLTDPNLQTASESTNLQIDKPQRDFRQIVSGIREHYPDPSVLVGRQVPVLVNLEPRIIRGIESKGMILYIVGEGDNFTTLEPAKKVPNGTIVR